MFEQVDGKGKAADPKITSQMMKEFEEVFSEWQTGYPTCEDLEIGGQGELQPLLQMVIALLRRWGIS